MENANIKKFGVAALVVVFFIGCIVWGVTQAKKQSGKTAGEIVEASYEAGSQSGRGSISYRYRYTVDGKEYTRGNSTTLDTGSYRSGARGTVCYDPNDPNSSTFTVSDINCGGK